MARLPAPGGDNGTWGVILNDYLAVSLDATGALNADTVGTTQIANNAVTSAKIQNYGTANGVASLDASALIPDSQLPTRLSSSTLNSTYAAAAAALPTGGTTGQQLQKTSGSNYAVSWANPGFATVSVVNGSEARPSASFVLWVGGSTQPTNMAIGDVWMKAV